MTKDAILIRLSREEALVLFEFLSRNGDGATLAIQDQAERRVLWDVEADLERALDEPFLPDYDESVRKARDAVRDATD